MDAADHMISELGQRLMIDKNRPCEIFYYQQLSQDRSSNCFNSPWGGIVLRNCLTDGRLIEFSKLSEFETFYGQSSKHMWLYLKLKIFRCNNRQFFGVFVCPECSTMEGIDNLQVDHDPEDILGELCMHSRVASTLVREWWRLWTFNDTQSELNISIIPFEDCLKKVFISNTSDLPFLVAILHDKDIILMYNVSKRQTRVICSKCSFRKCHHETILSRMKDKELDVSTEPVEVDPEEDYHPSFDTEEKDFKLNNHYMIKPPKHIRGMLYGYNFEEILYPFSRSSCAQSVWLERLGGNVNLPDSFVPMFHIEDRCQHNEKFDDREDSLILESKSVCLYNDLGERTFPIKVYARPTTGSCRCLQRFDGNRLLLWNLGKGRILL